MSKPTVIRKNPVVIVYAFLALQFAAAAFYLLASSVAHYASIYRSLGFDDLIPFQLAQSIFIFGVEAVILFYMFFKWHRETLVVRPDAVVYSRGVMFRKSNVITFNKIDSVSFEQGPFGKLAKFGTIILHKTDNGKQVKIGFLSEPQDIVALLTEYSFNGVDFGDLSKTSLNEMTKNGEHEKLEFKGSFRWDRRGGKVSKQLEYATMKTIAAFMNTRGGRLLIGVDDDGAILGLADDYTTLGKSNWDGLQNHMSHIFNSMIGADFRQFMKVDLISVEGKDICVIDVMRSPKPIYLRHDDGEEFYIRTGNGTTPLTLSKAHSYIRSRFLDDTRLV